MAANHGLKSDRMEAGQSLAACGDSPVGAQKGTASDDRGPLVVKKMRFGERKSDGSPTFSPAYPCASGCQAWS